MSKRNHRHDTQRRQQILTTPTNQLLNERIVQEFVKQMANPNLSEQEFLTLQLRMQQFLSGDASLLNQAETGNPQAQDQLQKMHARRDAAQKAEEEFLSDPERFVEDTFQRAERVKSKTPEQRNRRIANALETRRKIQEQAKAQRTVKVLELMKAVASGPRELVHIEPEYETQVIGSAPQVVQIPVVVGIMGKLFELKPGDQMVPSVLARVYRQKQRQKQEQAARSQALLLERNRSMVDVELDMRKIDKEYHSNRQKVGGLGI